MRMANVINFSLSLATQQDICIIQDDFNAMKATSGVDFDLLASDNHQLDFQCALFKVEGGKTGRKSLMVSKR